MFHLTVDVICLNGIIVAIDKEIECLGIWRDLTEEFGWGYENWVQLSVLKDGELA